MDRLTDPSSARGSTRRALARLAEVDPRLALALSAVTTTVWLVAWPALHGTSRLAFVAMASLAYAAALNSLTRSANRRLDSPVGRTAIVIAVLLLAAAALLAPRGSHDVWSYVMYGRTVAIHHSSPYTHAPSAWASDPFLQQVSRGWRDSPSVYGPAFTVCSAGVAAVARDSALVARLAHQLLAAGSVMAVGLVTSRSRRDITPLVFLAFNPAVVAIVNGGHNDLLTGALIAGAVALASRRRPLVAGIVMSIAVLVKVIALLPGVVLIAWLWHRYGRRAGVVCGVATAVPVGVAYLAAGGIEALEPVLAGADYASRASLWSGAARLVALPPPFDGWSPLFGAIGTAMVIIGVLAAVAASSGRPWLRRTTPAAGTTGGLVTLIFVLPYVLPWYSGWVLPTATLVHSSRLARFARWQSTALVIAYADPPGVLSGGTITSAVSRLALPLTAVAVMLTVRRQRRGTAPET